MNISRPILVCRLSLVSFLLLINVHLADFSQAATAALLPTALYTDRGSHSSQPLSVLATQEESNGSDGWNNYIEFSSGPSGYEGRFIFSVPASIGAASGPVSAQLAVNFKGPTVASQRWRFEILDQLTGFYIPVGDNTAAQSWTWTRLNFSPPTSPSARFFANGQATLRFVTDQPVDDCDLDYLTLTLNASASLVLGENFCIDYQYYPNTNNLRVYDFSILSPYCQVNLSEAHALGKKAYAYISAGEIAENAQYYQAAEVAGIPFIGRNPNWDSLVVDLSSPLWPPFVIAQLAAPAVEKGYDGFFLDTMDSYELADPSLRQAQETGLVNLVKKLKAAYPTKKIIINRGFPVFSRLVSTVDGMLVEGLFYSYPGTPQDQEGTEWLLGQIAPVKAAGKAVYIVDYLSSALAGRANETAKRIQQLGFNPLISGPNLDGTVLAPVPPNIASIRVELVRVQGQLGVQISGNAGETCVVEASENLVGWEAIAALTLGRVPAIFIDPEQSQYPKRFYRVRH